MVPRALLTEAAAQLLRRLAAAHGPLLIHQSGGCCDGSSPMCYPAGEFLVGDRDVLLGVGDLRLAPGVPQQSTPDGNDAVPLWISGPQFAVWQHTQLVVDVVAGRGSGFSLEAPEGVRLLTRGRVFTAAEQAELAARAPLSGAQWLAGSRPEPAGVALVVAEAAAACPVPPRAGSP